MIEKKQENRWIDRNNVVKTFKIAGNFGWMHLVIGENKITKRKFLRLKRYMNWFSIPDVEYLTTVQGMLKKGCSELKWEYDESKEVKAEEVGEEEKSEKTINVSDEAIDYFESNPNLIKEIIELKLNRNDLKFILDLAKNIDEAILKSTERFKIAFQEVIKKLGKQKAKGLQELSDLMTDLNLLQITSLTNTIKQRLETIGTFEAMIHDPKTYEINTDQSMHRLLEKSMWIIDDNYWIVQSNKSLRTFIGDEVLKTYKGKEKKRPDFVCCESGSKLIIIEIKKPGLELKKKELDQAEFYLRVIKKYRAKKFTSVEAILIGNKISLEAQDVVEFRKGLKIKTYSDFLSECRDRYQEYLKIIENENQS